MKHVLWALSLWAAAVHAQVPVAWKLATGYRAESFHTQNLSQLTQDVNEATQGRFAIAVHPDNSLVALSAIEAAVRQGQLQAGEVILTSLVSEMPLAGADAIPFVVGSYDDARRMWALQRPLLERHLAQRGLMVLYAVPWPPQGLFSTTTLKTPVDLKGQRMRTYNHSTERIAEMFGAVAVDVPMVQVDRALARGEIDSMITSALTGVENKVWGRLRYFYEINAWFPKNLVLINRKAFEALVPEHQAALQSAAKAAESRGWAQSQRVAAQSMRELADKGVKVERLPLEFEQDLKRMGAKLATEWVRRVGNEANQIFVPFYFQH